MTPPTPRTRQRLRRHRRRLLARARRERRGVLMLVVLSMLILFLLIGATFLVTSNSYQTASRVVDKANRTTFQPEDVLERALMQLVRDTNNGSSVIRYHSLLRDLYGTDGFVGRVVARQTLNDFPVGDFPGLDPRPRYAGADPTATAADIGPTQGQLIDLYVLDEQGGVLDATIENVIGLDFDENGEPFDHLLSSTDAYYEGCLLTMLDGPCRGQSVRIVDYDHIGTNPNTNAVLGRLRVMAPRRIDGEPLEFVPSSALLADFVANATNGQGHRFMVNGRPLNGTGVGYNPLASPNSARLTAVEQFEAGANFYGLEHALIPNPVHFFARSYSLDLAPAVGASSWDAPLGTVVSNNFLNISRGFETPLLDDGVTPNPDYDPLYTTFVGPGGADESYDAADYQNMFLSLQSPQPRQRGRVLDNQGNLLDPAAYYLGRQGRAPELLNLDNVPIPAFHRPALTNFWFHRLYRSVWLSGAVANPHDRVRVILDPYESGVLDTSDPRSAQSAIASQIAAIKRKFSLRPLREDHPAFDGSNPLSRYRGGGYEPDGQLVNARGTNDESDDEITFPYWEAVGPWDVDNDGDGVMDSVWVDLGLPVQKTEDGRLYKPLVAFLVEDLDGRLNLNAHGSTEHFTNLQNSPYTDDLDVSSNNRNLAQDYNNPPFLVSSNQLPHGGGWGPADITLRPVLSPDLPLSDFVNGTTLTGNAQYDDYARLLVGRPNPEDTGRNVTDVMNVTVNFGRYGSFPAQSSGRTADALYSPGKTFFNTSPVIATNTREGRVPYDFPGYPEFANDPFTLSGFGERPDLFGRYSAGVSVLGQPVYESIADGRLHGARPILDDSPYELDLSAAARRRSAEDLQTVINSYVNAATAEPVLDDAPFSVAELERVLRATDGDADKLPDRLWKIVDAFDPEKQAVQQAIANQTIAADNFVGFAPNSLQSVVAQSRSAINRRLVTTDSYHVPAPNENWLNRLILGADGLPGVPQVNDEARYVSNTIDTLTDEGDEAIVGYIPGEVHTFTDNATPRNTGTATYEVLWNAGCDDYSVVMFADPPISPRITDYLRYRVRLELARKGTITLYPIANRTPPNVMARLENQILYGDSVDASLVRSDLATFGGLLSSELLAGLRMNVNRPFGDGRDNNGNGVVDEPEEAGEPYTYTVNGAGSVIVDNFLELDGNGFLTQDVDRDGILYFDTTGDLVADTFDDGDLVDPDGRGPGASSRSSITSGSTTTATASATPTSSTRSTTPTAATPTAAASRPAACASTTTPAWRGSCTPGTSTA